MAMTLKERQRLKEFFKDKYDNYKLTKPAWLSDLAIITGRSRVNLCRWFAGDGKSRPLENQLLLLAKKDNPYEQ